MAAEDTSTVCSARFGSNEGATHSRMSRDAYAAFTIPAAPKVADRIIQRARGLSSGPLRLVPVRRQSYEKSRRIADHRPDRPSELEVRGRTRGWRSFDGSTPFSSTKTLARTTEASSTS